MSTPSSSSGRTSTRAVKPDAICVAAVDLAREAALERWGRIDVLVNAAGGNVPGATVGERLSSGYRGRPSGRFST